MSKRLQRSLLYSFLTTVLATAIMRFWSDGMSIPVFAVLMFMITFSVAYWKLFASR